jgi:hypothetical protein
VDENTAPRRHERATGGAPHGDRHQGVIEVCGFRRSAVV